MKKYKKIKKKKTGLHLPRAFPCRRLSSSRSPLFIYLFVLLFLLPLSLLHLHPPSVINPLKQPCTFACASIVPLEGGAIATNDFFFFWIFFLEEIGSPIILFRSSSSKLRWFSQPSSFDVNPKVPFKVFVILIIIF